MSSSNYFKAALLALVLSSVYIFLDSGVQRVSAQTAPTLSVNHATCYEGIIDSGDLYCLARYELPNSISDGVSDAWCAELFIQTGCDGSPAIPTEPTSLPQNTAFISLYEGCTDGDCSAGTLLTVNRLPRIGFAVGGSYMSAGHTVTFGDSGVALCVEASATVFSTPSIDCRNVNWSGAASTQQAQRADLGQNMVFQVLAVGIQQAKSTNFYIENNLINSVGKPLALEALPGADRFLSVFASGSTAIVIETAVAASTVQANINSSTTAVQNAKTNFGTAVGLGGDQVGLLLGIILVIAVTISALIFTRKLIFALVAGVSFASVLVLYGLLPFQALALLIAVLALPAAVKVIRQVTQE